MPTGFNIIVSNPHWSYFPWQLPQICSLISYLFSCSWTSPLLFAEENTDSFGFQRRSQKPCLFTSWKFRDVLPELIFNPESSPSEPAPWGSFCGWFPFSSPKWRGIKFWNLMSWGGEAIAGTHLPGPSSRPEEAVHSGSMGEAYAASLAEPSSGTSRREGEPAPPSRVSPCHLTIPPSSAHYSFLPKIQGELLSLFICPLWAS